MLGLVLTLQKVRHRRNLIQFGDMIMCATNLGVIDGLRTYNGYGCYCGLGGGGIPLDDTDTCCQVHDACYNYGTSGCWWLKQYFVLYDYTKDNCGTDSAEINCKTVDQYGDDNDAACKAAICKCDSDAALCFARNRDSQDDKYEDYDKSLC
uniref:Phospholipase A2 n=1 Tax=Saccoglossus kowalevskii TaxID=10224 RepID=A0ABM0MI22_SACKO|nr:PREDICTED: phospholipase A2 AP-PLA2-I-like [Saccoglossus kowalevskii]